jgi:PAS domain S-box
LATIRAENALHLIPRQRADELLFADAFEHAPNGMALLDRDGRITQANIAFCKILGFSRTKLLGLASSEITHSDDIQTDAEQRRRLGSGEIDRFQLAQRFIRKDGEATWVVLSVSVRRRTSEFPEYYVLQVESGAGHLSVEDGAAHDALVERVSEAMHEIGNTLTPLMLSAELIVEQSKTGDICDSAHVIFKAARRIAFTLRRLRGINDLQAVAYLGPDRMLDLRMVAPPKEVD